MKSYGAIEMPPTTTLADLGILDNVPVGSPLVVALSQVASTGIFAITSTSETAATVSLLTLIGTSGNIVVSNGDGVSGNPTFDIGPNVATLSGDQTFSGQKTFDSSLAAGSTTFSLINTTATTINFAGAATALSIGSSTGTTTVNNGLTVTGAITTPSTIRYSLLSAGAAVTALSLANPIVTHSANTEVRIDLAPNQAGVGVRSAQIAAISVGQWITDLVLRTSNSYTPIDALRITGAGISTFYGNIVVDKSTANAYIQVDANSGYSKSILFTTNSINRWESGSNPTAETGSNAGSDYFLARYSDAGALIDNVVAITRSTGLVTLSAGLTIGGDLTVNGTTTTINAVTVTVDDKNIELGSVTSPTNITADGGGIRLKGATDKTLIWDNANSNWTSSEHWNLASGKALKINNVTVLDSSTLGSGVTASSLTSVGTLTSITVAGNTALGSTTSDTLTVTSSSLNIDASDNIVVGTAALATNATNGFLYIPTCAGPPTGVPTTKTGRLPIIYDSTNNKLYAYNGAWKGITLA